MLDNKKYSHYGASRLCEASSARARFWSLRSLGWVSDKRGSLRSQDRREHNTESTDVTANPITSE